MESLYEQAKDEVNKMQRTRQGLSNDIDALKYKISILDKTAFSIEQDCKRKQQQLQALTAQKDRLEKWIAMISNNDELKQLVKENVKAALSENKQVISIAFIALLQTLRSDPQMIDTVYKILAVNDREQDEDINNNAIEYFEVNKDRILDLTEKNYENLLEELTNNVMNTAANSSYNHTLSLPQSSPSIFKSPSNQSDIYRIEESDIYDDDNQAYE